MNSTATVTWLGFILILAGIAQLFIPLDFLWKRQEWRLQREGIAAQRSPAWEERTRVGGWITVGLGVFIVMITLFSTGSPKNSGAQKMSGASIDGHEFTQAEWDACNHEMAVCASLYAQRHSR